MSKTSVYKKKARANDDFCRIIYMYVEKKYRRKKTLTVIVSSLEVCQKTTVTKRRKKKLHHCSPYKSHMCNFDAKVNGVT